MPRNLSPSDVAHFRNQLCDVATQMLAEVGSEGFNMRELAVRMGVSAMTTYRYFKDKNEILLAVRKRAFARFADGLEAAISACASRDEKLEALSLAYARFARDERVHCLRPGVHVRPRGGAQRGLQDRHRAGHEAAAGDRRRHPAR